MNVKSSVSIEKVFTNCNGGDLVTATISTDQYFLPLGLSLIEVMRNAQLTMYHKYLLILHAFQTLIHAILRYCLVSKVEARDTRQGNLTQLEHKS